MSAANFSTILKKRFSPSEWPWLLLALRQDRGVWEALEKTDLGAKALDKLPAQAEAWSPAAISLLALENPLTLEILHKTPLEPLGDGLIQRSDSVYKDWIRTPAQPASLDLAGLLALAFREQFRQNGDWQETLQTSAARPEDTRTIFCCLFGMLPQPAELLLTLFKKPDMSWTGVAIHLLLANPKPPEFQLAFLNDLLIDLEPASMVAALQVLAANRPYMAALLARQMISSLPVSWSSETRKISNTEGLGELEKLLLALRTAQVHQIAGQADMAVPVLSEGLRTIRKVRGHISAELAHSVAQTKDLSVDGWGNTAREASVEAWKQALQLSPDEPRFAAGYGKSLLNSGRAQESVTFLKTYLEKPNHAANPELMLTFAMAAEQINAHETALVAALKTLELIETGGQLSEKGFVHLTGFLLKENELEGALQAAQAALQSFPASHALLALRAKIDFTTCQPEAAVDAVYAAQAIQKCEAELKETHVKDEIAGEDGWRPSWLVEPDKAAVQKILVDSLEALSIWEAAFDERMALMEGKGELSTDDLKELANCAAGAKKHDKVIEICEKLLQNDPSDLLSHQQLAEAAEAIQDYDRAVEHFNWAVRLAPEKGVLWKGLFRSLRHAGQEAEAMDTLRAASQAIPDDPDIQLQLGELYLEQDAPTLALPCLKKAYAAPGSESSLNVAVRLGETLCQLGRLDEARQILEPLHNRIVDSLSGAGPTGGKSNSGASDTDLVNIYARTMLSLGEPEKSVPVLSKIVRDRPDDPRACLDLSRGLMMMSDRGSGARRAIPFLQRLLGITPDGSLDGYGGKLADTPALLAEARLLLAEAYAANCEWEKAMDAFRVAMDEPVNQTKEMQTRLSIGLGMTALKLDLPEMAVAALQEAAQSEPLNGHIQKSLCEAYISNGLSQDAFLAAEAALDLAPTDGETIGWFIDQGLKIAALPGAFQQQIFDRVIHALQTAVAQSPERADLIIRLGSLLVRTGHNNDAVEVFRKLAALDSAVQKVSLPVLCQAFQDVLAAGDARLAVNLIRKTIDQIEGKETSNQPTKADTTLVDLYEVLIRALEQLGDLDGALEAIEHALKLDDAREALYAVKADVLFKLGKLDAAKASLETALKIWPEKPDLRLRMGRVLRSMNDLMGALSEVERGIESMSNTDDVTCQRDLYLLAARLAWATLRPRRAFAYLQKAIPETDPEYNHIDHAIMRAEYALDAGEQQSAAQAVSIFAAQASNAPRLLADSGRLDYRLKNRAEGDKKCRSAVQLWTRLQMGQPGQKPATSKEEFMGELVALGMAALESRMWKEGLSIFRQMVTMFPEEPLAHYMLAQALMYCAEGQALCQDFEVVKNAPGQDALSEAVWKEFEDNIKIAAAQLGCEHILKDGETLEAVDVEIKRALGIAIRRGRAVFIPSLEIADALEKLLQMITPLTEDLVSLVMVYRRCGAKERAIKSIDTGWKPVFEGKDIRKEPQVIIQLALTDDEKEDAVEAIRSILASPGIAGLIWPEPVMLEFLLAKLSYLLKDYPSASEAIQKALTEWPDEARWQALAAAILLASPTENRAQQISSAARYLERAVGLEPGNSDHQLALGEMHLRSGQVKHAVQYLEQAARLNPSNGDAWLSLASAQNILGNLDQASMSADQAVEKSPKNPAALLLRSEIALKTRNYRGALNRAQAVLRLQPEHPKALVVMAKALEGLERPSEALSVLEKAMQVNDDPIELQLERLNLIKRSQGLEFGLKALQDLVAQNPKQASYLALLAEWLLQAGKQDAAVQAAKLALQDDLEGLSPQQKADLHTTIGLHMQKVGQLDQAIHHLSEATLASPDYVDAYLALGRVYQERREYQQSLKTYQKAINFAGGDYRPYFQAGLVLKDNKDYMAAEAMLRRAAQLAPNEVSVHRMLGAVVALNLVHSRRLAPNETRRE